MAKRPVGFIIPVTLFILASLVVVTIFVRNWLAVFSGPPKITGQLIVTKRSLRKGEQIAVKLTLPEKFESVNRLQWTVDPPDAGKLTYSRVRESDAVLNEHGEKVYPKTDRIAEFTAQKPGRCTISVSGFYRDRHRQPAARIDVAVLP